MSRATQSISILFALISLYIALFLGYVPVSTKIQEDIVPVLPFWSLVSFGAFLLARLGYGVMTINDVPEAHAELMAQIQQARTELKAKGVTVD